MQASQPGKVADTSPPFFLGRQPILDRDRKTVAYELLFRTGFSQGAQVTDDRAATAAVIAHAFGDLGIATVLGGRQGFINFDASLLLSDVPELLPAGNIVIEILETVELTPEVHSRCLDLRRQGFRFALDDVTRVEQIDGTALSLADIVKVDVSATPEHHVPMLAQAVRGAGVKSLAEKVDSPLVADRCLELGFDLFQGFHFARPVVLAGRRADPGQATLLRLLELISEERSNEEIAQAFKQAPALTFKLMRLVNSVGVGVPQRIESLSHALVILGERQLRRWLQVLLFANQDTGRFPSPLLALAVTRGKLMELLAARESDDPGFCDQAFMTGIMSMLDALLGIPMEELLAEVNFGYSIHNALKYRGGRLGRLLKLVEALERTDTGVVAGLMDEEAGNTITDLPALQIMAMNWVDEIGAGLQ
jgi:c-di-GMP-related signal transduction protein